MTPYIEGELIDPSALFICILLLLSSSIPTLAIFDRDPAFSEHIMSQAIRWTVNLKLGNSSSSILVSVNGQE
jgi:hypothetical protein